MRPFPRESTALVHDWLVGMRGGEKCLEVLCELFPTAPVYTLVGWPDKVSATIAAHELRTSFLQRMPLVETRYRHYLPLFPRAIESFAPPEADLVVSSSHAVAKGIRIREGALHVSYVHTPMRYVWDMFDQYFPAERVGHVQRAFIALVARRIRRWDVASNVRVHHFIANSHHVRERIRRFYGRDAAVIHPPVDTARFAGRTRDAGYFLIVSALVPYKKTDLAVRAFNELRLPLRVIGTGPELAMLQALAGPTVTIEGWCDDATIADAYAECRALVFPGEEDFGIVPVEAMAAGRPVIAFGRGGALDTVLPGVSGLLFPEQTTASLIAAVRSFRDDDFDAAAIRSHALRFDRSVYAREMDTFLQSRWADWSR